MKAPTPSLRSASSSGEREPSSDRGLHMGLARLPDDAINNGGVTAAHNNVFAINFGANLFNALRPNGPAKFFGAVRREAVV